MDLPGQRTSLFLEPLSSTSSKKDLPHCILEEEERWRMYEIHTEGGPPLSACGYGGLHHQEP
eukprot:4363881-Amphidinium_carterae.1